MHLRQLFADDEAVSPVIGVILMVAITVILAAVIGAFVLGFGDSTSSTPTASFDSEIDSGTVTFTMLSGGDTIDKANLDCAGAGVDTDFSSSDVSAGSTVDCEATGGEEGEIVTLVWDDGDSSSTLAEHELAEDV